MLQAYGELTLRQVLEQAADQYGYKTAIKEAHVELSFAELEHMSWHAASAFSAKGVTKGDRVAIWAPNVYEWIVSAIGLELLGAVLVPLNTRWKGAEVADVLNRADVKLLLTVESFQASPSSEIRYCDLLESEALNTVAEIVLLRGEPSHTPQENVISFADFLLAGEQADMALVKAAAEQVTADDIMDMLPTSGTTGKPKLVMCAHGQNLRTVATWAHTNGLHAEDNYLIINPFFHSFGYKAGWLACLITGATIYPVLSFDLDAVLQQIADDKISMLPGPPTIYQSILAHPQRDQYDLSSLRLAVTGAAPVPVELVNRMRNEMDFEVVVTAYGMTETSGFVSICRPDDPAEIISGSSGRAMDGIEVKIVDADGQSLPAGETGEIWVRGYNVMQGYFGNPEATQETITEDGWLKTGDVGVMDADGYIDITDRIKDMIISGGFNVYPAELENSISAIDGVVQVAIIGVPDARMGEVGKAFIVKAPGSNLSIDEVTAFCKANMANYKVPRSIEFIDIMPMNASGKILKTELRKLVA
ncbi:MAG: AMP-binding protein [Pseudomonadales bacterium]|nr:AMP-binding protein [Pseudomonadales bacterium]